MQLKVHFLEIFGAKIQINFKINYVPGVPTSFRQEFSKKSLPKKLVKVCLHFSYSSPLGLNCKRRQTQANANAGKRRQTQANAAKFQIFINKSSSVYYSHWIPTHKCRQMQTNADKRRQTQHKNESNFEFSLLKVVQYTAWWYLDFSFFFFF